uniref:Striatin n=1 Tax=Romanomermis culicivorax TaxID=13658 RepID=A0A915K454_ROMCU
MTVPLNDTCKTWSARYTLRSHFDTVRCIAFHPVEPILLTASEDATLKMWNLQQPQSPPTPMSPGSASVSPQSQRAASGDSPGSSTSSNGKKQAQHELEPTHTFRGHSGPILCMCISPTGEYAYTGGLEGIVRCWTLPPVNVDLYDPYDPSLLVDTLRGHTDAVWSVAFHSSDNRLISASSDGTLKLWEPGSAHPLSKTYVANDSEGVPTSVDFVSTDPQQAIAAFSSSNAFIYDLEIGKSVLNFENNYGSCGRINQLISHPTLPITITAHEDRRIRFFDNNTGKTIDSVLAHLDSVSCLAIDPNGLYLLSGSHDSSLRLWNLDSKSCIQEITAHRRKFDESVMAVAFHPSRPYIASGGTDGCAKVFV